MIGADSTPARPARKMLAAHTATDTAVGLIPDNDVMAGESTIARTRRPTSVYRSTSAPTTTTKITQPYTMIWSTVTGTPRNWYTCTGSGARPGALRMIWLPNNNVANGAMVTDRPNVATTLIRGDDIRSSRNKAK